MAPRGKIEDKWSSGEGGLVVAHHLWSSPKSWACTAQEAQKNLWETEGEDSVSWSPGSYVGHWARS